MIAFDKQYHQHTLDVGVALMLRLQSGDTQALADLREKYAPLVFCIVVEMMGSDQQVEDVTQDVFIRVFRARDRYLASARFSTWISVITRNIVSNTLRNERRRRTTTVDFSQPPNADAPRLGWMVQPTYMDNPINALLQSEDDLMLGQAIDRLSPRYRQAIRLVYFEGLTYVEAAERMQSSMMAVKAILVRARAQIRQLLQSRQPFNECLENRF